MNVQRVNIPTRTIKCACVDCAEYAKREGLTTPLRAEVNEKMLAQVGTKPATVHRLMRLAYQPTGGAFNGQAAEFGPWAINDD